MSNSLADQRLEEGSSVSEKVVTESNI